MVVPVLSADDSTEIATGVFEAFLANRQGPAALTTALKGKSLRQDVARIGLRVVSSSGRKLPELTASLTTAGNFTAEPRKFSPAEMQKLVAEVAAQGDPARGELVFRRADLGCVKCHAIGGAGGLVGPDLVSIGGSAQVDYLIESLYDPSTKIKENYHTLVVATDEGKVLSGVFVRKTDSALILRDAEDREISIPLDSIDEQTNGASVMPVDLPQKMTHAELLDLVRFLSELGKVGPYAIGQERVVRRWQILQPTQTATHRFRRTQYGSAATDDDAFAWDSVYSTVAGKLPTADLQSHKFAPRVWKTKFQDVTSFVRFELEVTTAGKVDLAFGSPAGLQMWVDGKPVNVSPRTTIDLSTGKHRVTLAVNLTKLPRGLRVELLDSPGSNAQAQIVGGK